MAAAQRQNPAIPDDLDSTLAQIAGRVRGQRMLRFGLRGIAAGLGIDIVTAFVARAGLLPLGVSLHLSLLCIALLGAISGVMIAARARISPLQAASLAEARFPLKERLTSALEFSAGFQPGVLLRAQHRDAVTHARTLKPASAVPLNIPREAVLLPVLLFLLALTLWLPALPFAENPAHRAEREAVQRAGNTLTQAAQKIERAANARHDAASKASAQRLQKLGQRMARGHMDKTQALSELSREEQEEAAQQAGASPSDPGQAARSLAQASHSAGSPAPGKSGISTSQSTKSPASPGSKQSAQSSSPQTKATQGGKAQQAGTKPGQQTGANGHASEPGQKGSSAGQGGQDIRRALENARQQAAPSAQPGSPSGAANGHSPSPNSYQGNERQNGPSQSTQAPGAPGPGGDSGKEIKFPFHNALPPANKSRNHSLSLGSPGTRSEKSVSLPRTSGLPATAPGTSRVPLGTALPAARRSAETAMGTENIPPSQRAAVRDYFNSLQNAK